MSQEPKTETTESATQPETPAIETPKLCDAELVRLLNAEPVLCLRLKEALLGGRWLVTIHRKVKDSPPDDLQSAEIHKDFPAIDAPEAMQGTCRAMLTQAGAEIQRKQGKVRDISAWR